MSNIEPSLLNARLLEIQQHDTRIFDLRNQISNLSDKHHLGELREEIDQLKESLSLRQQECHDLEHRQRKLDGELDQLMTKIKVEKDKLFSGTIMNPKELSGINEEIQSLEKKRDEMETEDLELMEAMDSSRDTVHEAEKTLEEELSNQNSAKRDYDVELADLEAQAKMLEEERNKLKEELDSDTISLYEKLLGQKAGLAVAEIEQGRSCGGCHIEFSMSQVDRFQHEEGYFRCEFCNRILVK